jgi:hypothetical protein
MGFTTPDQSPLYELSFHSDFYQVWSNLLFPDCISMNYVFSYSVELFHIYIHSKMTWSDETQYNAQHHSTKTILHIMKYKQSRVKSVDGVIKWPQISFI